MAETRAVPFLFDLDGTLVDGVYQHVLAWHVALEEAGIALSVWRIHRKIGMSGGLFTNALLRETGLAITGERVEQIQRRHAEAYARRAREIRPLPGARELLASISTRSACVAREAARVKPRPCPSRTASARRPRSGNASAPARRSHKA
jgi:phosphoglycolate phosphatase-like HAD superfamily hydrolase